MRMKEDNFDDLMKLVKEQIEIYKAKKNAYIESVIDW